MSSREESFVRSITENPDDDVPRLVFADYLEEHGDVRGEFIRVQCELEQRDAYEPRRYELESRELQLIRQLSKGWGKPVRDMAHRWTFRRGMVYGVRMKAKTFLQRKNELFAIAPIQSIDFIEAYDYLDDLSKVQLSRLRELGFSHGMIGRAGRNQYPVSYANFPRYNVFLERVAQLRASNIRPFHKFLQTTDLESLISLNLDGNSLGPAGANAVIAATHLTKLKSLSLGECKLTHESVENLSNAAHLGSLRDLRFSGLYNISHSYDEDWVGRLTPALRPWLSRLDSLGISQSGLSLIAIASLSDVENCRLRKLDLSSSYMVQRWDGEGGDATVLGDSPLLSNLAELDISSCYVRTEDLATLGSAKSFQHLRVLRMNNSVLNRDAGEMLCKTPFTALAKLSLNGGRNDGHSLGDTGVDRMLQSEHLLHLSVLELRRQQLTDIVIPAFVDSMVTQNLYKLDLRNNHITDDGAALLAAMQPWPKLAVLNLRGNPIGPGGRKKLRDTFGYRVIY